MLTDVISLWEDLSAECKASGKILERLVRPDNDIEIVLRKGPNFCSLLVQPGGTDSFWKSHAAPTCMTCSPSRERENERDGIDIRLRDSRYERIFVWFSQDLANRLMGLPSNESTKAIKNCLDEWAEAFKIPPEHGMSRQAQQGLFAELFFLEEVLIPKDLEEGVLSWNSQNSLHDFQIQDTAWEIKSFASRRPEVRISSEDQLDTAGLSELYLVAVELKVSDTAGTKVSDIVESVLTLIGARSDLALHFRTGLAKYRYIDETSVHEVLFFTPKSLAQYRISPGFPRLVTGNLPSAVHNVKYVLSLASLDSHVAEPIVRYGET